VQLYHEIAIGSPRNRGLLIPKEQLIDILLSDGKKQAIYKSLYLYDEEGKSYHKIKRTFKDFLGKRYINNVLIDIDKGQNTDDYTLNKTKSVLFELEELGVQKRSYQIYYSGTGYHIEISEEVFNFPQGTSDLPFIVKETMNNLFGDVDLSVYNRTSIYRCENTLNQKSNLYKIPLTNSQLSRNKAEEIKDKARNQVKLNREPIWGDGELEDKVITEVPKVRVLQSNAEPTNIVPCVQKMYKLGPEEGSRNNTLMRIASHFFRHGIPSEAAKAALLHWNNGQLEDAVIIKKVEDTYSGGYKYGCKDVLMEKHCQPNCIHYKRKDYLVDVKSSDELQTELASRLETDFSGRVIDLAKLFGVEDKDATVYPGELVTIFGSTGANKTALAQNIVLGYNAEDDEIKKEAQIPTLFLSLELSGFVMHRRNLQIVSGTSKDEVVKNYQELYEYHKEELSHIIMQSISPTIQQIQEKIKQLQPKCVVIDYIDLVDVPYNKRGEYEKLNYISHSLSNIAVNEDIIIVQISQVSRDYSRNQIMDLYAAKGSGAIENASRKVIGITGSSETADKKMSIYKNSDGDLFEVELNWTPSFRLKKKPTMYSKVLGKRFTIQE
jgi:archaellum biogenesis ATPase FlaH